ncbi:hypothetical protein BHUM_03109 [Candidatus Burkholderia humilis]|nr:hypothetical protein BHUM_03109 [Candidatus Burkholderia humilis]
MNGPNSGNILRRFEKLNVWKQGDQRAPHKLSLVLLALGLFTRDIRSVRFVEYERALIDLLREFGPERRTYAPELPFLHLRSDGVWRVTLNGTDHTSAWDGSHLCAQNQ